MQAGWLECRVPPANLFGAFTESRIREGAFFFVFEMAALASLLRHHQARIAAGCGRVGGQSLFADEA